MDATDMAQLESRRNLMRILCCECGESIEPNPTNMCAACLRSNIDITASIPRQSSINHCKGCERWLSNEKNQNSWVEAGRESKELLAILLRKVKSSLPNTTRLTDASFIWTEPHSKRLRVKISVQQEIQHGAILEQSFPMEFIEAGGFCLSCHRDEAKDFWKCVVQVRQKRSHKKTFLFLEQLILKFEMQKNCVKIGGCADGLDFFFADKQASRKFLEFLQAVMPIKYSTSQKLISHDVHTSTYNYKYTTLVDLPIVSKDDIICLPKAICSKNGNIGPLVICQRVTQNIHLIDFHTLDILELTKEAYWRAPFKPIADKLPLTEYMCVETEPVTTPKSVGVKSKKHELGDLWVIQTDRLGSADQGNWLSARTHLGKLLNPGDLCLGFDVRNSNISEANWDAYRNKVGEDKIPDVIIVRKSYGNIWKRHKKRMWQIKRLAIAEETESRVDKNESRTEKEMLEFLNEIEEDEEYRKKVKMYKDEGKVENLEEDDDVAADVPEITLDEMLPGLSALNLNHNPDVDMEN